MSMPRYVATGTALSVRHVFCRSYLWDILIL